MEVTINEELSRGITKVGDEQFFNLSKTVYDFKQYKIMKDRNGNDVEVYSKTLSYTLDNLEQTRTRLEDELVIINEKIEAINELEIK